jgi:hypothetical protein
MPLTIDQGWNDFHERLTPTGSETQAAKDHRASIEACLQNNFGLNRFFRCGSFGNGTSISGYSDVDYLASIPPVNVSSNSQTFLVRVRTALDARFPQTGVHLNSPAVAVPFRSKAESTEIVPARYGADAVGGHSIYVIADGNGGWMPTSPEAHNAYVRDINDSLNGKVKPLVRFMKAWKYYNDVPISSFFLEMYTAQYAATEKVIIYSIDVQNLFSHLSDNLAPTNDPKGIAGNIYPCVSPAHAVKTKLALADASRHAAQARAYETSGEYHLAFIWWDLLFNDKFPSYYGS